MKEDLEEDLVEAFKGRGDPEEWGIFCRFSVEHLQVSSDVCVRQLEESLNVNALIEAFKGIGIPEE